MPIQARLLRRPLAIIAGAAILLTGCGGDSVPTKAEFTTKVRESIGKDISTSLEAGGVDAETTDEIVDDFIGCVYDELKDDEELLNAAFDEDAGDKVTADLEANAQKCVTGMTAAMQKAITPATP